MAASLAEANRAHIILLRAASVSALPGTDLGPHSFRRLPKTRRTWPPPWPPGCPNGTERGDCRTLRRRGRGHPPEISLQCRPRDHVHPRSFGPGTLDLRLGRGKGAGTEPGSRLLLVRPSGEIAMLGPEPAQASVLDPLDGSPFAEAALPHAATLAKAFGSTILLLHATGATGGAYYYPGDRPPSRGSGEDKGEAESYPSAVAERLRSDGLSVETILRKVGRPMSSYQGCNAGAEADRDGDPRSGLRSRTPDLRQRGARGGSCTSLPVLLICPGEPATEAQK